MTSFYEEHPLYVSRYSDKTMRNEFLDELNYRLMSNSTYRNKCYKMFNHVMTLLRSNGYKCKDIYQLKEDITFYIYLKTYCNKSL